MRHLRLKDLRLFRRLVAEEIEGVRHWAMMPIEQSFSAQRRLEVLEETLARLDEEIKYLVGDAPLGVDNRGPDD